MSCLSFAGPRRGRALAVTPSLTLLACASHGERAMLPGPSPDASPPSAVVMRYLYPYDGTVFPRGLSAPVLMCVILRIPPGAQAEVFVGQRACAGCHALSANGWQGFCSAGLCVAPPSRCAMTEEACESAADCCDADNLCINHFCSEIVLL